MEKNVIECEDALKEEESRFNLLFEYAPDPIIIVDVETSEIVNFNERACENLGYTREEFKRLKVADFEVIESAKEVQRHVEKIISEGSDIFETRHRTKTGEIKDVLVSARAILFKGRKYIQGFLRDITQHKRLEGSLRESAEKLSRINEVFLRFGADPNININSLTILTGQLLDGACALYNRLEKGMLCSTGKWNTPPDYNPVDKPDGHICYDVIKQGGVNPYIVHGLQNTLYVKTDPNVAPYGLMTYIGQAVKCGENYVGSLCVVYQKDFIPSEDHKKILGILASAIGVEEERRKADKELKKAFAELSAKSERLEKFHKITVDRELEMIRLKMEINGLLEKLGQPKKYDVPEMRRGD